MQYFLSAAEFHIFASHRKSVFVINKWICLQNIGIFYWHKCALFETCNSDRTFKLQKSNFPDWNICNALCAASLLSVWLIIGFVSAPRQCSMTFTAATVTLEIWSGHKEETVPVLSGTNY